VSDWLAGTSWDLRPPEVGSLCLRNDREGRRCVAFQMETGDDDAVDRMWRPWLTLPPHAHLLEPIEAGCVRYAAIDFTRAPVAIQGSTRAAAATEGHRRLAQWGLQLARTLGFVSACVPADELGWLACPFALVDAVGDVRIGFMPPSLSAAHANRLPPEVIASWPRCDDSGLVFVVGQLLLSLVIVGPGLSSTPIGGVMRRCLERDPAKRYATLGSLHEALVVAGARRNEATHVDPAVWWHLEVGIGYLTYGRLDEAAVALADALDLDPQCKLARLAYNELVRRGGVVRRFTRTISGTITERPPEPRRHAQHAGYVPSPPEPRLDWADAEPKARALERERCFVDALRIYEIVRPGEAALDIALARVYLALGDLGHAIDHAQRALARSPDAVEAMAIRTDALLGKRQFAEALAAAEAWLAHANAGRAHYARGKALFALGRLAEARDAFDRACSLAPELIAAMLLRREADRALRTVRETAGAPQPLVIELPERLAALRDVLVAGRIDDAIALLRGPDYAGDPIATLALADLLAYAGRADEALVAYETAGGDDHALVGKGYALLELGRAAEALAVFERLPDNAHARDGRDRALASLR
jgi:tetratricopeptide (TPR) repeat protein